MIDVGGGEIRKIWEKESVHSHTARLLRTAIQNSTARHIMEIGADAPLIADEYNETLSYDDTVPYEEQVPSLADRIGRGKVYLLEDSSVAKSGKVCALGHLRELRGLLMLRPVAET